MSLNKIKINDTTTVNTGIVYDISKAHNGATYTDLTDALSGNNVPSEVREGGMSIRFVSNSDNKYIQFRLMSSTWSINTDDWAVCGDEVLVENPEYTQVIIDSEDKVVACIKRDGKNFRICDLESEELYRLMSNFYKGDVNSVQPYCGIKLNNYRTVLSTLDNDAANFENGSIGAAQIIKLKDNLYYLYYSAIGEARELSCPLIAYSTDGLNYTRGIPPGFEVPYPGTNHLIFESVVDGTMQPNGVGGWCFFKVNDSEYPFRLFACNGHEDVSGKKREYLWKSADGIRFVQPKLIVDGLFDTTPQCIVRGNIIKIYGRMWDEQAPNQKDRFISLTYIDLDGNIISPTRAFMGGTAAEDYYTSGANIIDERREILFPTLINDSTQEEELKCFIVDGEHIEKIDVDFSPLISNEDKQWYIRSIFSVELDLYIVYTADSFSHAIANYSPETGHTDIRIAKIDFLTKGYII